MTAAKRKGRSHDGPSDDDCCLALQGAESDKNEGCGSESTFLCVRLNPQGGRQAGSDEPSAGE